MKVKDKLYVTQIQALLWKDFLVRIRQPWMTIVQFVWPCAIFLALYTLRNRFQAEDINACQFPTRQLPSKNELLPFFQSYICTIENQCSDINKFKEISEFENAPITPALNIIQTFINEEKLYDAIIKLPTSMNFVSAIIAIATHDKFSTIEANVNSIVSRLPEIEKMIGTEFDINKLFSNDRIFSNSGNILCGSPFPRSDNIRFVDNIIYSEDFNGPDKDELDVMPTQYCKQLYLDVTNTNNGKITWRSLKPIIQGKILYGPANDRNNDIIKFANQTFEDLDRLKIFASSLDEILTKLKTNDEFREKFLSLVELTRSPLIQALISGFDINTETIENILQTLLNDDRISNIIRTISNIFECMSSDRFVAVKNEKELEDKAFALNDKKLFFAGIYFNDNKIEHESSYKIRMDIDNTPLTQENRNRFWFPGPEASFELDLRYHRGFVQIQHALDIAIIKYEKRSRGPKIPKPEIFSKTTTTESDDDLIDSFDFSAEDDNSTEIVDDSLTESPETESTLLLDKFFFSFQNKINISEADLSFNEDSGSGLEDFLDFKDDPPAIKVLNRTKRAPQFEGLLGLFFGGLGKQENADNFDVDSIQFYTKQEPYQKYTRDDFKRGLYLAQSVQMAFFFALIVQIAICVRQRIWMKESGNSTLMRVMGLRKSSEYISWSITTFIELAIVFLLAIIILYTGGILIYTQKIFLYFFLLVFGVCVIAFCYMTSTFFSSASIGSVTAVLLFLMTFLPYIVIISLGATLTMMGKFFANLSISTAFCYAWHYILRSELQIKPLNFETAFSGTMKDNEFKFGFWMIVLDLVLYTIVGYLIERYMHDDFSFYKVPMADMDSQVGAVMRDITKVYEKGKTAIKDVSLLFRRDQITCLLGRNGAGKSTIIKILTGQTMPTFGEVHLPLNYDRITGHDREEKVGLCPQNHVLIPNLTAREHLDLYTRIKLNSGFVEEVERIMASLNLGKYENYKSQELSGGFRRRLCIAIAFIASPNLVILDEPCSGVDTKARKCIWELIGELRKGRAVILATHHLDEAEHLSDHVVIMSNGSIVAENSPADLQNQFTRAFNLEINLLKLINKYEKSIIDDIILILQRYIPNYTIEEVNENVMRVRVPYVDDNREYYNYEPLMRSLEQLQSNEKIKSFRISSKNLADIFTHFNNLAQLKEEQLLQINDNHITATVSSSVSNEISSNKINEKIMSNNNKINGYKETTRMTTIKQQEIKKLTNFAMLKNLLTKRLLHFKRNYRLLICILVLPTIFEIIAMGFMTLRPPGGYEKNLEFALDLYKDSQEYYSYENDYNNNLTIVTSSSLINDDIFYNELFYNNLNEHCTYECEKFNNSLNIFNWLLATNDKFINNRYGGVSINNSRALVWYNNKGYHSMPLFLNQLNTAILQAEMNDLTYNIRAYNHPLKLGEKEFSTSAILQQIADAGISLIMLIAFSLVTACASVYIVNERINGEKLQQTLSGVKFYIYWFVHFCWDYTLYIIALMLAVIVFKIFEIPIYVDKANLDGICLLLFLYGFASIPAVHVAEKLFTDASFANMSIFCLNVIIALTTITIIILFDILGESDQSETIRNILNRVFLILPQHALSDGLIEICKNHIETEVFKRYYIDTYKSPITSNLLHPHYISLIIMGIIFHIINLSIESGLHYRLLASFYKKGEACNNDLKIVSIQNSPKKDEKIADYHQNYVLKVENLTKYYRKGKNVVNNVSFYVKHGECFGLLGTNGAGKSTIFSILSGQFTSSSGYIEFNDDKGVSYCPQNNALDNLLTVEEIIKFYGKLKGVQDLNKLIESTLKNFHLQPYKDVLVKHLSGGNRRKLSVAVTCYGNSSIVLMDEPTSDMDPVTRQIVYNTINDLIKSERSVLLTSHTISEIDKVCDRIAVLRDGQLISTGTLGEFVKTYGTSYIVTLFYDKIESLTIERDIKNVFTNADNIIIHNFSLQFMIKIKKPINIITNDIEKDIGEIYLSDLFNKLYNFTKERTIFYTISECHLDQIFEDILENDCLSYTNKSYSQSESITKY